MPDDKYGRLYTEDDVRLLIAIALGSLQQVDDPSDVNMNALFSQMSTGGFDTHFPLDEPLFLLRGKDEAICVAIGAYSDECERLGANPAFVSKVTHTGGQILAWQVRNRDRTKVAD